MKSVLACCVLLLATACAQRCRVKQCPSGPPSVARAPRGPLPAPARAPEPVAAQDPQTRAWELRGLPKAQRWARAQEEVHLSAAQVDALRAAVSERDKMLEGKTAIITRLAEGLPLGTAMGDDDEWTVLIDSEALRVADATFDGRVKEILDRDQMRLWESGGYRGVFGVRLPMLPPRPVSLDSFGLSGS